MVDSVLVNFKQNYGVVLEFFTVNSQLCRGARENRDFAETPY
jgi:hypothetical protein